MLPVSGHAVNSIPVETDQPAIDLTNLIEFLDDEDGRVQVETSAGADGLVRRMEVRATDPNNTAGWIVFALSNASDRPLDRLLVAPHHRLVGSGVFWPDLGAERIRAITPSQGFRPDRVAFDNSDAFFITLDPGATVTFVAEASSDAIPKLELWEQGAYEENLNSLTLFRGIVLGVSGLLALFLTTLFIVRGTAMFPAAALLGWAVVAYLTIDFNLLDRMFAITAAEKQVYRAGSETVFVMAIVIYLFAYLNLGRWHIRFAHVAAVLVLLMLTLLVVAFFNPEIAAGSARIAVLIFSFLGMCLIVYLAVKGSDRAIMLIPTWLLLLFWVYGAWLAVSGQLDGDLVSAAVAGGLVLVVLLTGFTVMQHAFAGTGVFHGATAENERMALALMGAGDMVWDWDVERDRIVTSNETERLLGLSRGALDGPAVSWLDHLHPSDRDRFRVCLDTMVDQAKGRIAQDFRLRSKDGHYRFLNLRARPITNSDGDVVRCIGTMVDVTDTKTAQERLLHDAIYDNLTGLPNKDLFLDRLNTAMMRARLESGSRPAIMVLDVDGFRETNETVGIAVGDSILLTLARRLARNLKPQDTLCRLTGDRFAIILISENTPKRIASIADQVRRAFKAPITFGEHEIFLTASIGIAVYDGKQLQSGEVLHDAELAQQFAKRAGGDRIEAFKPVMRQSGSDPASLEADLAEAVSKDQIKLYYQPIIRFDTNTVAGFEAMPCWDHPEHGRMMPNDYLWLARENDLVLDIAISSLESAAKQLSEWQEMGAHHNQLFTSVNVSHKTIIRHDLINDIKGVFSRSSLAPGTLKLEVNEALMMDNPEYTAQVLRRVCDLGAGLTLDEFGSGYSALSHLQKFPFDLIKLDRSIMRSNGAGAQPVIFRSIVSLARELGIEVIAEGASTEDDARQFLAIGCHYGQGLFFGDLLKPHEAKKLLASAPSEAKH